MPACVKLVYKLTKQMNSAVKRTQVTLEGHDIFFKSFASDFFTTIYLEITVDGLGNLVDVR